jgi:hypothetical protein
MVSDEFPYYTGQRATGRALLECYTGFGNFLVWTGMEPRNYLNLNFQKSGFDFGATYVAADISYHGPAFVLNPSGTGCNLFWTDASTGGVCWTEASPNSMGSTDWVIGLGSPSIPNSKALSGPTAALGMLDGTVVVNVIWQDATLNSMALWQKPLLGHVPGNPAIALGQSCIDSPTLVASGSNNFLAWFDSNQAFNLATAGNEQMTFDFANRFTTSAISSSFAPAFVPLNNQLAYVFWASRLGISYQQIGVNALGQWELNSAAGCSGIHVGILPNYRSRANGAPSACPLQVNIDGVISTIIVVAFPSSDGPNQIGKVMTATLVPNFTPVYVPEKVATAISAAQAAMTA